MVIDTDMTVATVGHMDSPAAASDTAGDIRRLRAMAVRLLGRMYLPEQRAFAFRLRRNECGDVLEGVSRRYTAIALIGLVGETDDTVAAVLGDHAPREVCSRLIDSVEEFADIGEVALTLWAARLLEHSDVQKIIDRLTAMSPDSALWPTVELSWCLTALTVESSAPTDTGLADAIASRLMSSFNRRSCLFPHWADGAAPSFLRAHVTCFADFVYPTQALAVRHQAANDSRAGEIACLCADRMSELQGPQGQWWWHYDSRTGRVLEGYPVYAIHQDSMAPMAFDAVRDACGQDHTDAVERGLNWLMNPPEISDSLVDAEADVIWRKVARHEPGKLVRGLQAAASRLVPPLRVPGTNLIFPPKWVDYESRPYHMGWILKAWPADSEHDSPRP